jgi:IS1 family transposase
MDEQWSYVGKKSEQRGLWYAIDHVDAVNHCPRKGLNYQTPHAVFFAQVERKAA